MKKTAIIFGITGQDGSHLTDLLLEKGYEVHGIIRRASNFNTQRIEHVYDHPDLHLHYGDVTDVSATTNIITKVQPNEIYNLAAQSFVKASFEIANYTSQVDAIGTLNILEAVRTHSPNTKIYQASTSEMFGGMAYNMPETGYTEESKFHPRSPYGVAKVYGYWMSRNYRESYNMFVCNGILFNHGGERRGETFVERKISIGLTKLHKNDKVPSLKLGNLYSKRDLGYAKDFVEGMWKMLQKDQPDDYVLCTGETHTIKDLVNIGLRYLSFNFKWVGEGLDEKCIDVDSERVLIEIDEEYFRPAEVDVLLGDNNKAQVILGWRPKTHIKELMEIMIKNDLEV